jgi:hypothetical protein
MCPQGTMMWSIVAFMQMRHSSLSSPAAPAFVSGASRVAFGAAGTAAGACRGALRRCLGGCSIGRRRRRELGYLAFALLGRRLRRLVVHIRGSARWRRFSALLFAPFVFARDLVGRARAPVAARAPVLPYHVSFLCLLFGLALSLLGLALSLLGLALSLLLLGLASSLLGLSLPPLGLALSLLGLALSPLGLALSLLGLALSLVGLPLPLCLLSCADPRLYHVFLRLLSERLFLPFHACVVVSFA